MKQQLPRTLDELLKEIERHNPRKSVEFIAGYLTHDRRRQGDAEKKDRGT